MTGDDFSDSFYYRAIRTKIGEALRSQLLAKEPPPERVLDLLQQLDQADGDSEPPAWVCSLVVACVLFDLGEQAAAQLPLMLRQCQELRVGVRCWLVQLLEAILSRENVPSYVWFQTFANVLTNGSTADRSAP